MSPDSYTVVKNSTNSTSQYDAVMRGLSRCKTAYQNHVKEMGGVRKQDVAAWCEALRALPSAVIERRFAEHCRRRNFWPKFSDITEPDGRMAKDRWDEKAEQADVSFAFDENGTVKIGEPSESAQLPHFGNSSQRVVPANMTSPQKKRFCEFMENLRGDEAQRKRRRIRDAAESMRVKRRNALPRNPAFQPTNDDQPRAASSVLRDILASGKTPAMSRTDSEGEPWR